MESLSQNNMFVYNGQVYYPARMYAVSPASSEPRLVARLRTLNPPGERNWVLCNYVMVKEKWGNEYIECKHHYLVSQLFPNEPIIQNFLDPDDYGPFENDCEEERIQIAQEFDEAAKKAISMPPIEDLQNIFKFLEDLEEPAEDGIQYDLFD
jgi:hypothetical protein